MIKNDSFSNNLSEVCSNEIHYFKSIESELMLKCNILNAIIKNNKLNGKYIKLHGNDYIY